MAKKYQILRKKYPKFVYENFDWQISRENLEISFDLRIPPDIKFQPQVVIKNVKKSQIERVGEEVLDNLVFHLGLIETLSYWKATCSPEILIKAGHLNKEQIKWWKNLIERGMDQFFFENKIDFQKPNFLDIACLKLENKKLKMSSKSAIAEISDKNRILVPVGGGKDSIVTLEILKKVKKNIACFSLNPSRAARKVMKVARCQNQVIIERKIDKKLLELNQKGFLNGHTPFSAYLAFLSVLIAVIYDYKYIAFSNERSSNEGNVEYLGRIINHQYSKSFDFERKFRKYSKRYLAEDIEYFSFLRPLYEIQIAKLFTRYPKYFRSFISCNVAFKTNSGRRKPLGKWCNKCPKCLFVFATLYPFLARYRLIKIFKENLFEKISLLPIMLELTGLKAFKPFECVGTKKESLVAFYLSWKKSIGDTYGKLPFLLEYFEKKILPKYSNLAPYRARSGTGLEKESKIIMNSWNKNHFLPKKFEKILKKATSS